MRIFREGTFVMGVGLLALVDSYIKGIIKVRQQRVINPLSAGRPSCNRDYNMIKLRIK